MAMGGAFGFLFGSFFGTNLAPLPQPGEPKIPLRVQMVQHFRESARTGMSHARGFAFFGGVFATTQCLIEKNRGNNEVLNGLYAGCITGGVLAYKGGTTGMAMGCAGIGAFSLAIDHFMQEADPRDEMTRFDPYDSGYLEDIKDVDIDPQVQG